MSLFSRIIKQSQKGILVPYLEGYTNYLLEKKYSIETIYHALGYIRHFGKYLSNRRMKNISRVSLVTIEKFLRHYNYRYIHRYRKPFKSKKHLVTIKGYIKIFLVYLQHQGVITLKCLYKDKINYEDKTPRFMRKTVKEYFDFCRGQRGIKNGTIYLHQTWILRFVNFIKNKKIKNIRVLKITDVDEFMSNYVSKLGRVSINSMHSVLRSFFRYLYMYDYIDSNMSEYIFSSKTYAPRLIPKHIPWKQTRNILKQLDTTTNVGKRLYAILVLFISYGLRPIEISKLKLSDINWKKREIFFSDRKSGKNLILPLKRDVTFALLEYLKIRPNIFCLEIFVTANAPHRPLSPPYIRDIVIQYMERIKINLPIKGPYIFRHTLAKKLLDKGVSITDISSVLGHSCLSSTMKYLRISTEELREVCDNYANLL